MKLRILALVATSALGLMASASAASAGVTVTATEAGNLDGPLLFGQQYIATFDSPINSHFTFSGDTATNFVNQGTANLGNSAPPPVPVVPGNTAGAYTYETSKFESVQGGGSASLEAKAGYALSSFSFYMGSPDDYNDISFTIYGVNGETTLSGADIWHDSNPGAANGSQTWGERVYYDFGGQDVTKITFSSGSNAFEFDGLAGTVTSVGGVPEPASWALMIIGFGGAGAALRSKRRRLAVATA